MVNWKASVSSSKPSAPERLAKTEPNRADVAGQDRVQRGTAAGKLLGFEPMLTPARLKFLGLNLDYSIDRAKRELNYQPETDFQTGMRKTIDWLRQENKIPS